LALGLLVLRSIGVLISSAALASAATAPWKAGAALALLSRGLGWLLLIGLLLLMAEGVLLATTASTSSASRNWQSRLESS
jgi:hypothetical protein